MKIRKSRYWFALLICCSLPAAQAATNAATSPLTPDARIESAVILHFVPTAKGDPAKVAAGLLQSKYPFFKQRATQKVDASPASVFVKFVNLHDAEIALPSEAMLKYFGHGIDKNQVAALAKSEYGLILSFSYGAKDVLRAVDQAARFAADVAQATDGLLWDDDTRELFSVAAWNEKRLAPWSDGFPRVSKHTVMHAYRNGEYLRVISLGMIKFGMPDVVVEDFVGSLNLEMSNLISIFSQTLIEGASIPQTGPYDLHLDRLKNSEMRRDQQEDFHDNAVGAGSLTLREGRRDDGDPDNRLIELAFDRYSANTAQERQVQFAHAFFGWHDPVSNIKHNEAILAASKRAKNKLDDLRTRFNKGLPAGQQLMVKAPFRTDDDRTEWMWVEVSVWRGGEITGLLNNQPEYIKNLRAGAKVTVKQADLFDYILFKSDGTTEGNETGALIEKAAK